MYTLASDNTKTIVIIVNDFTVEFGVALKKLSKTLGRELHGVLLIDTELKAKNAYDPDKSGEFEEIICNFSDPEALENMLKPLRDKLLIVTCIAERYQPYLKTLLPYIPYLSMPTESSLDWSTNKNLMRQHLEIYNSSLTPKYRQVTGFDPDVIVDILSIMDFPLIVKPTGLASSVLVKKVTYQEELLDGLKSGFKMINEVYVRDFGRGLPAMIVEEFIEGDMYSVDSYVSAIGEVLSLPLCKVTTAHSLGLEGFYSFRNDTYHTLTTSETRNAHIAAEQAIHALGLRSTVVHVELFKTKYGWKIIELGPRAGGYRQEMYELAYGIDHAYNEYLLKIGLMPEINDKPIGYSTIVNIYADTEGIIESVDGIDEAKKNPSIAWLELRKKPGDMALFCGNGGIFVVDGVLSNKDLGKLNIDVETVRKLIKINIKK